MAGGDFPNGTTNSLTNQHLGRSVASTTNIFHFFQRKEVKNLMKFFWEPKAIITILHELKYNPAMSTAD